MAMMSSTAIYGDEGRRLSPLLAILQENGFLCILQGKVLYKSNRRHDGVFRNQSSLLKTEKETSKGTGPNTNTGRAALLINVLRPSRPPRPPLRTPGKISTHHSPYLPYIFLPAPPPPSLKEPGRIQNIMGGEA